MKPEQKGIAPSPRFNHGMKFCRYLNCVIVYGGRNDEMKCCFSDIFTLNLESLTWIKLNTSDNKNNECKCSFAYDMSLTRMLVFGGINFNGFMNNELYVIEFDDSIQKRRNNEEKMEMILDLQKTKVPRTIKSFKTFLPLPENK